MNEIVLNIASHFVDGKPIYPALRRSLNFLFNVCIASSIFEHFYGHYYLLDITDYKRIILFFIRGNFFIPFCIFLLVYSITQFLAVLIFNTITHIKSIQSQREILKYQYKKSGIDEGLEMLLGASKYVAPIDLVPEIIVKGYEELRQSIKPELFQQMVEALKIPKDNLEKNFILGFRLLITICLFKVSLPNFTWFLFLTTTTILSLILYLLTVAHQFLDILPAILKFFHAQAEKYFFDYMASKNKNSEPTGAGL